MLWSKRLEPKRTKNRPELKIDKDALVEDIKKYPDAFNYERANRFNVSTSGICWAMKRLGVTYKKNSQSSQSSEEKRQSFQTKIEHYETFGRAIIYIDESGFAHDMPRTHGYSKTMLW